MTNEMTVIEPYEASLIEAALLLLREFNIEQLPPDSKHALEENKYGNTLEMQRDIDDLLGLIARGDLYVDDSEAS